MIKDFRFWNLGQNFVKNIKVDISVIAEIHERILKSSREDNRNPNVSGLLFGVEKGNNLEVSMVYFINLVKIKEKDGEIEIDLLKSEKELIIKYMDSTFDLHPVGW